MQENLIGLSLQDLTESRGNSTSAEARIFTDLLDQFVFSLLPQSLHHATPFFNDFAGSLIDNIFIPIMEVDLNNDGKGDLKTKIQKLIHQIDKQVEDKIIKSSDFKQIHYTRLNSKYKTPLVLSKLILEHTGFKNIKQMETDLIVPFFVNMPKLFEKFL